ncbi:hypothetical protein LTR81_026440 [Elasticomyces elasticus]
MPFLRLFGIVAWHALQTVLVMVTAVPMLWSMHLTSRSADYSFTYVPMEILAQFALGLKADLALLPIVMQVLNTACAGKENLASPPNQYEAENSVKFALR